MPQVSFQVNDAGVSSFIQRIRQQGSEMSSQMIREAATLTSSTREQYGIVEQRLRASERQLRLDQQAAEIAIRERAQNRIITNQARIGSLRDDVRAQLRGGQITGAEARDRFERISRMSSRYGEAAINSQADEQIRLLQEQVRNQQLLLGNAREETRERRANDRSVGAQQKEQWVQFAKALAFEKVGGMVASMPNAQNELDYVKPMASMMGFMTGAITGSLIDLVTGSKILGSGVGQTQAGALLASLGEKAGEFVGSAMERSYKQRDELTTSNFRLKALTGRGVGEVAAFGDTNFDGTRQGGIGTISNLNQNLERFGMSMQEVSKLQYELSMRQGSGKGVSSLTTDVVALEKGIGVNQQTTSTLIELFRQNKEGDRDVMKIIGGVLQKGQGSIFEKGDRTYLNEFLSKNFSQLQKSLLQTQTRVSSGGVMDILTKFDKLGGEFDAKDSRSTGYINTIQGALANPGSDSMKALAYHVMRKNNPEMGLADIGIEIQKGLGSKTYLQSMMKYLTASGGGDDYQTYNVASAFGLQNNLAVAKRLLQGYKGGALGDEFSQGNLAGTGEYGRKSITSTAEGQVSIYSQSTAEITNAFTRSAIDGISKVESKMVQLFGTMMDGVISYINVKLDDAKKGMSTSNKTHTPTKYSNSSMSEVDAAGNLIN